VNTKHAQNTRQANNPEANSPKRWLVIWLPSGIDGGEEKTSADKIDQEDCNPNEHQPGILFVENNDYANG